VNIYNSTYSLLEHFTFLLQVDEVLNCWKHQLK